MSGIWIDKDIEILLRNKLDAAFGNDTSKADSIYSDYTLARKKALEIASQINRVESNLTDHSPEHIANVLDNTYKLIDGYIEDLNFAEIYFLCLIIQFHDIGNINGRKDHQLKITNIYNSVRGTGGEYRSERDRLFRAVSAHCGELNGDRDTLKKLNESSDLLGMPLRLKELAAILRFADELAEGPQRTCDYIIEHELVHKTSLIYHAYAKVTNIYIDKTRISVSYHIDLDDEDVTSIKFEDLLSYIYTRIIKLDEERRYCKYYSTILGRYKKTQVTFYITRSGFPLDVDIPEIQLSDKFNLNAVDDGSISNLLKEYPQLDIARIVESISKTTAS